MDDLSTWLRAQLDAEERLARSVEAGNHDVFNGTGIIVMHAATGSRSVTLPSHVAAYLTHWDPARVLAEVEAKRRILDLHEQALPDGHDQLGYRFACEHCAQTTPCPTLRLLALPYAGREGYQDEWRPSDQGATP